MVRMQKINDLELFIDPLSDSIVEVVYQEQVGWFGVNLGEEAEARPFAWTTDPDSRTQDGLIEANPATDPAQALEDLSARLASMQSALDAERASDPRHNLGAFLETLPQAEAKKEPGWRNLVSGGLRGVNRSKDILRDRASKSRDILQDGASKSKDILQDRASKSKDILQDRASKSKDILQDRASKSKDILQDGASKVQDRTSKGFEALREAASPSRACEREGHVFDDVRLIGSLNNLPRFCRRCRNLINVAQESGDAAGAHNAARPDDS